MRNKLKLLISFSLFFAHVALATPVQNIKIIYLSQQKKVPAALSNLDPFIQNKGQLSAQMAVDENNITGQFTGQHYELTKVILPLDADIKQVFKQSIPADTEFIISLLSAQKLHQLTALPEAQQKLIFDAATLEDSLRSQNCQDNVLHLLPSRAMRADALAQFMLKKRWQKWFLVVGSTAEDQLFANAIKRAAKRFGMKIVAEKKWTHTYDARRTAQSDVPVFTQEVSDYDVLVVADEQGLFGEYLSYRTWLPRPVIGTQGLVATSWHRSHEQWGAVQIQNRFKEQSGRWMEEQDYGAYLAVRAIGEAATRTKSTLLKTIKNYLLGDSFALQGYKGKPLSFRAWNGQLRQPVLLTSPRSLVTAAPIEGFLHPKTALDSLGFDEPESTCGKK